MSTIRDLDAMAAAMRDAADVEYVQLESKPFTGAWACVRRGPVTIQLGRQDVAIVRRLRVRAERWMFAVPLAVPGLARWNGRRIRGGEVMVSPPGAETYAFEPGGMRFALLSVDGRVAARIAAVAPLTLAPAETGMLIRPDVPCIRALQHHLRMLVERAGGSARGLLNCLIACLLTPNATWLERLEKPARSEIVRRAENFIRAHVGESVSMARLSEIAGVSERSLRNAFYETYAISPKRYLRIWQLHQVRRALRTADPHVTVTNVATFHGFFELGRFAGAYKALFGEAPSQTLRRTLTAPHHLYDGRLEDTRRRAVA